MLKVQHLLKPQPTIKLPLTSMVDMFTIMLVFLLKSFSESSFNPDLMKDIAPPVSINASALSEGKILFLKKDGIHFDSKTLVSFENFKLPESQLSSADPKYMEPIAAAFELDPQAKVETPPRLHIIADRDTPYPTLRSLLYTLSLVGQTEVQLVTVSGGGQ